LVDETAKAHAAYQDFLALWKDAGPDTTVPADLEESMSNAWSCSCAWLTVVCY